MKVPEGLVSAARRRCCFHVPHHLGKGRKLLAAQMRKTEIPAKYLFAAAVQSVTRVPGPLYT